MIDQAELIYERILVVRAQTGDVSAFAELVEQYSPKLRYPMQQWHHDRRWKGLARLL